ncbi:MAG: hypothetical protein JNM56_39305 [Planctomycetia bacterium]|nr:hypothetical protein [Planctomycetia bacterium]
MATASVVTKDLEPAAREFVQKANAEQLQAIVSGTLLARHPHLEKVKGSAEEKTEGLRKLVAQNMRRRADLRGMVIRHLAQKGLVSAPVKEKVAKTEAPAAAKKEKEGKEGKPKEKKEKPKAEEKKEG